MISYFAMIWGGDMTFKELCDDYLAYHKNILCNSTYYNRAGKIRISLVPYFGTMDVDKIKPEDVKNWKILMLNHKIKTRGVLHSYSERTLSDMYHCLVYVLNYGMSVYGLKTNAATTCGKFKKITTKRIIKEQYWTLDEYRLFSSVIDDEKWKLVFDLLYFTGARLGEIRALQWTDLNNQYISITKSIDDKPGAPNKGMKEPKNQYSVRDVRLPVRLYMRLLSYKDTLSKKGGFNDNWFIIGNAKPASKTNIRYRKEMYSKKAGLPPITLHGFRHSHVSMLINSDKNVNLLTMANRLGHKNATRILKVYAHMWPNQQIDLDDALDNATMYMDEATLV